MSDLPSSGPPPMAGPAGPFPPSMPPGPWSQPSPTPSRPARWQTWLTLVIAFVALGVAVGAWLRPAPAPGPSTEAAPTFSDEQVADAKAKVCAAYEKVRHAVEVNEPRNGGDDPNAQLLVAVNGRQIMVVGSAFLLTTLSDEPATPSELAKPVTELAELYQIITLNGLVGEWGETERNSAERAASMIRDLCK